MRKLPLLWAPCAFFLLALSARTQANPVITEFMADNASTIRDNFGAYSDWIEVHNPTAAPIPLAGWYLTDTATELRKWQFPEVTLAPGEFLVVWASGSSQRNPAQPLHTNFSLRAAGEYLALVAPDGVTIQQQFAPEFPALDPNESYGLQFTTTNLLSQGANARYFVPTDNSAGTSWTTAVYNDGTWSQGPTGIGYGLLVPGITVREVRKNTAFGAMTNLADTDQLLAYPPGSPQILSQTTAVRPTVNFFGEGGDGHYGANQQWPNGGGDHFCIKATGVLQIPTAGPWTFGVNSDDGGRIRINGQNVMVDDTNHGPSDHFGTVTLPAGSHTFEVVMWEQGGGDECEFFAAPGSFGSWGTQFKLVGDTANGGLAVFTSPSGVGSNVIATNIESAMRNVNSSAYVRTRFNSPGTAGFTSATLRMRYNDGYIAYLNGTRLSDRNAPATPAFNSTATQARSDTDSLIAEPVNVTAFLPQLLNGENVLAIHGLNLAADNPSFLVLPELVAGSLNPTADSVFYDITKATPGAINGQYSLIGKVADTSFSVKRGFFTSAFTVAISTLTPGATIRYTTDRSTPSATNGTVYTGPVSITGTTVLRAAAFKPGFLPTNTDTQTYIFTNDVIRQSSNGAPPAGWPSGPINGQVLDYGMDPDIVNHLDPAIGGAATVQNALKAISTVSIVTDQANLTDPNTGIYTRPGNRGFNWERPCSFELINPPNALNPNGSSEFQVNCGLRIRGGFSRSTDNPKHAFHLFFRGDYGTTKLNYPLFGREGASEFDQIDLRTAQNYSWSFGGDGNNTFLREESTRRAQTDIGQLGSHVRYVHLYVNGQYWGLFNFDERTEASFASTYLPGKKDDFDVVKAEQDQGYITGVTDGNLNAWQDLWNKSRAHYSAPTAANYFRMQGLAADGVTPTADPVLLDVNNLIDYLLITFWSGNLDGTTSAFLGNDRANNWFGARNRNGKLGFKFFAHDFEHTFFNTAEDRTGPFSNPTAGNWNNFSYANPLFLHQDLTPNLEYKIRWADRVHRHMFNNGQLTPGGWVERFNKLAAVVDTAIAAESARWGDAKVASPLNRTHWMTARNQILNNYIPFRHANVIGQLRADGLYPAIDAPTLNQFGGYIANNSEVTMSGVSSIYYTLDGSDPRLLGGGLNPAAQLYVSAVNTEIMIPMGDVWRYLDDGSNQGTAWRTVGFNDGSWKSGPAELGYGDGDEATRVEDNATPGYVAGEIRFATTYFRKTFNVTNASGITGLSVSLEYDDAAAVYINGVEVQRVGGAPLLPANPAFDYFSGGAIEDTIVTFQVNPTVLVNGPNTIAVEIHQASNTSSDISFNLSLSANRTQASTPLRLTGSGEKRLRVRSLSGGVWSAMADALFLIDTVPANATNLVVSEIMYHPKAPSKAELAAGFSDAEAFEYLELTNAGAVALDLEGLYFGDGVDFDFKNSKISRVLQPGGRVLLVSNQAAFEFRYGTSRPIAGVYSGNLNNAGENLSLMTSAGAILRNFAFDDATPWPSGADGAGYSLVLRRLSADPSLASSWRESVTLGGSPGSADGTTFAAWKSGEGILQNNDDRDGDGLLPLLEYALGGSAQRNDATRLPVAGAEGFSVSGIEQVYATIRFTRAVGADDIDYIVESSENLSAWSAQGLVFVSATRRGDGTETALYRSTTPLQPSGSAFMRLRAVQAP